MSNEMKEAICRFFFDGFVVDYLVQSKISDAKEQVSDAIYRVEQIMNELKRNM